MRVRSPSSGAPWWIEAAPSACCEAWRTQAALPQRAAAPAAQTRTRIIDPRGRSADGQRMRHTSKRSAFTTSSRSTPGSRARQGAAEVNQAGTPSVVDVARRGDRCSHLRGMRRSAAAMTPSAARGCRTWNGAAPTPIWHRSVRTMMPESVANLARSSCARRQQHSSTQQQPSKDDTIAAAEVSKKRPTWQCSHGSRCGRLPKLQLCRRWPGPWAFQWCRSRGSATTSEASGQTTVIFSDAIVSK